MKKQTVTERYIEQLKEKAEMHKSTATSYQLDVAVAEAASTDDLDFLKSMEQRHWDKYHGALELIKEQERSMYDIGGERWGQK